METVEKTKNELEKIIPGVKKKIKEFNTIQKDNGSDYRVQFVGVLGVTLFEWYDLSLNISDEGCASKEEMIASITFNIENGFVATIYNVGDLLCCCDDEPTNGNSWYALDESENGAWLPEFNPENLSAVYKVVKK